MSSPVLDIRPQIRYNNLTPLNPQHTSMDNAQKDPAQAHLEFLTSREIEALNSYLGQLELVQAIRAELRDSEENDELIAVRASYSSAKLRRNEMAMEYDLIVQERKEFEETME